MCDDSVTEITGTYEYGVNQNLIFINDIKEVHVRNTFT